MDNLSKHLDRLVQEELEYMPKASTLVGLEHIVTMLENPQLFVLGYVVDYYDTDVPKTGVDALEPPKFKGAPASIVEEMLDERSPALKETILKTLKPLTHKDTTMEMFAYTFGDILRIVTIAPKKIGKGHSKRAFTVRFKHD